MKNILRISFLILAIFLFSFCKKDKPTIPVIATKSVTEISTTTALSGGDIKNGGGVPLTAKGVCWNTSSDPTPDQNRTIETGGSVSFISTIAQLSPNTTYYIRAYATNSVGTGYGNTLSFKTLGDKPASTTLNASNILTTSATLNGTVNPNLLSSVVTFEYGTTVDYGSTKTAVQSPVTGNTAVNVSSDLSVLMPGTIYHFRIKAENSLGVIYSNDMTFKTLGQVPDIITKPTTNLLAKTATLNCTVNPNYLVTIVTFEWGLTASYGNSVTPAQNPLTGSTPLNVSIDLTGLAPATTYHFRIKAENSLGITYSGDLTFTTFGQVPTCLTQPVTNLNITTATINGAVNPNYLSTDVFFEWGLSTTYGNTVNPTQSPLTGSTSVSVNAGLTGLTPNTEYHYRVKAANELGTTYGNDLTFITYAVADIDNNFYHSVIIGTQTWLTENLKTTKFGNGDLIGTTTPANLDLTGESTPRYQWAYGGIESNAAIYGRLYTWYATIDSRKICPAGWHVPTDADWATLDDYLIINGYNYDGTAIDNKIGKSLSSTILWNVSTTAGAIGNTDYPSIRNKSGFTAIPAGLRTSTGTFTDSGRDGYWWSATLLSPTFAWVHLLDYNGISDIRSGLLKDEHSFSVRCIKD